MLCGPVSVVNVAEKILTTEARRSTESHRDSEIRALPAFASIEIDWLCSDKLKVSNATRASHRIISGGAV